MGSASRLRPPAVPLVTVDPYFSIWSMADRLYDDLRSIEHFGERLPAWCVFMRMLCTRGLP